jgi:hypothetical protein
VCRDRWVDVVLCCCFVRCISGNMDQSDIYSSRLELLMHLQSAFFFYLDKAVWLLLQNTSC